MSFRVIASGRRFAIDGELGQAVRQEKQQLATSESGGGPLATKSLDVLKFAADELLRTAPHDCDVDIDLWGERSPRTRQKVTSVVCAFWSWAEEQGHIAISPAARIRRPRAEKRVAPLLPADARPRLLTIAKHPRDRLALFCLLLLGVRRGELAGYPGSRPPLLALRVRQGPQGTGSSPSWPGARRAPALPQHRSPPRSPSA